MTRISSPDVDVSLDVRRRPAGPAGEVDSGPANTVPSAAQWASSVADVDGRMFDLGYRVATALSLSPKASERLCRQILHQTRSWADRVPVGRAGDDTGRRVRGRLLVALRSMVGPQVDPSRLERALDAAVLADELTLLPPRQQATIRWTMQQRCTVRQITERMGWTPQQVARLLRAGLTTLAVCGHR